MVPMPGMPRSPGQPPQDWTRWPGMAAVMAGVVLLAVGLVTGLAAPLVAAIAVIPATVCYPYLMLRPPDAGSESRRLVFSSGLRMLTAGVLFTGVSVVGAGFAVLLDPSETSDATSLAVKIPLVGLFLSAGTFLLGLLYLPGVPLTPMGRLRRTLDGVAMGACGFFVAWLLLFAHDGVRPAGLSAILLSCTAFCAMVITGLRSSAGRSAGIACGGGIALSIAGLTQLVVALEYHGSANRIIAAAVAVLASNVLVDRTVRAVVSGAVVRDPVDGDADFGGYPLFALPLVAALLAWAYHFVQRRSFDSTSIALALVAVVAVTLRGALASLDARHYADRLSAREAHFRSLFSGSTDVIMVLHPDLLVRWQSPAAANQFGLSDQDVVGRPFTALLHPEDRQSAGHRLIEVAAGGAQERTDPIESRLHDGDGRWRDVEWRIVDRRDVVPVAALVLHLRDVGERKWLERTLHRAIFVDQLTGLPNRQELSHALADGRACGVLMVFCLAGVVGVNDTRGLGVGDAVLVEAARRIREGVSHPDLAVRLEGDRFAVLTGAGALQAQLLGTRLLTLLAEPYPLPGGPAHLSANAGLAETADGLDGDEVLRRAELALRQAGQWDSGGAVEWYDEAVEAVLRRQLAIDQQLPGLLTRAELELVYQPVVELPVGRPVGVETVLRWRHPQLGLLTAEEFLPMAERAGLAAEIVDWALRRGCRALSGLVRDGFDVWMSLDVPASRLADPGFLTAVESALTGHAVPASRLVLEIAEPGLTAPRSDWGRHCADLGAGAGAGADARAEAIMGQLAELRMMGVRVALDRFGTASTSLDRLRVMPVDLLKIDRQLFDQSALPAASAPAIIDVVVKLGERLGMAVVAQGLQAASDLDMAQAAGCRYGQGDVFCRPVPAEHLEAYLDNHRSPRW